MEIVTGKAGTPHVSSADDGRRIAGEVGAGSYVLQTGGRLAPSLVDANTVRFATGDMVVQGRHIGLTAPEDVKVASGTQGKKRTDYICVHYKRDVSGANPTLVEKVEWKVLQGTPGATATAPTVPAGSILNGDADVTVPVCSVSFDGLTTGAPKLVIPTLTPLATLGDSVSRAVLFNNRNIGFTDVVTLSQDPSKFARIEFTCVTDDNDQFTVFYVPGLWTTRFVASCARVNFNSGQIFLKTRVYEVSGRTVNTANDTFNGNKYWHSGQVSVPGGSLSNGDKIKIIRAVGYMS